MTTATRAPQFRSDRPNISLPLPDDWRESAEINDGQPVRVFHPPPPAPGVLRVLTDRIATDPAGGQGAAIIKLRETALRFVRPDDSRAYDRIIEDLPGGGVMAAAVIVATNDAGDDETHYLWMAARIGDGPYIDAAMAALALPRAADGDTAAMTVAAAADNALRAVSFL